MSEATTCGLDAGRVEYQGHLLALAYALAVI